MSSKMSDVEASYVHHPAPKRSKIANPGPLKVDHAKIFLSPLEQS